MTASLRLAHVPILLVGPFLLAGPLVIACRGTPTPAASGAAVGELERDTYTVEVGDGDRRVVSSLRAASADQVADRTLVLYVHGTPGAAKGWADYLIDPVSGVRAVAVDRPGFGDSDSRALATLDGQARALAPLIESAERVILVGHSYGGPVALQAALDWPERVQGVVVIAGSVSPELETRRWFNYVAKGLGLLLPRKFRRANDEVWPLKADLARLAKELGNVRVPVAIVHGTRDRLVPYGNVAFMEQTLTGVPRLDVHTLDGAGHFVIWRPQWEPQIRAAIAGMIWPADRLTIAAGTTTRSAAARPRARARTR